MAEVTITARLMLDITPLRNRSIDEVVDGINRHEYLLDNETSSGNIITEEGEKVAIYTYSHCLQWLAPCKLLPPARPDDTQPF